MVFLFTFKRDSYDYRLSFYALSLVPQKTKDTGTRFGLFYYNNWNPKEETLDYQIGFRIKDKETILILEV